MEYYRIEFLSVFEATRGLTLLRLYNPDNKQWEYRDHNYGSLKYYVNDKQLTMLKDNNVGYIILND